MREEGLPLLPLPLHTCSSSISGCFCPMPSLLQASQGSLCCPSICILPLSAPLPCADFAFALPHTACVVVGGGGGGVGCSCGLWPCPKAKEQAGTGMSHSVGQEPQRGGEEAGGGHPLPQREREGGEGRLFHTPLLHTFSLSYLTWAGLLCLPTALSPLLFSWA